MADCLPSERACSLVSVIAAKRYSGLCTKRSRPSDAGYAQVILILDLPLLPRARRPCGRPALSELGVNPVMELGMK
jgi:hypothetical protein